MKKMYDFMYYEWWVSLITLGYLAFNLDTDDTVFVSLALILTAIFWAVAAIRCNLDNNKNEILEKLNNNDKTE